MTDYLLINVISRYPIEERLVIISSEFRELAELRRELVDCILYTNDGYEDVKDLLIDIGQSKKTYAINKESFSLLLLKYHTDYFFLP